MCENFRTCLWWRGLVVMRQVVNYSGAGLSLILCVAMGWMWVRSFRVFDQWYGDVAGMTIHIESYSGRCDFRLWRWYVLRKGVDPNLQVDGKDRPFQFLKRETEEGPKNWITRQRWPLVETERWVAKAGLFPGMKGDRWLAWGRDGPGRYVWVDWVQIPYWMAFIGFAFWPTVVLVRGRGL